MIDLIPTLEAEVLSKPCLGVLSGNDCDHSDSGLEDCGRCQSSSLFVIFTAKSRISAKVMIALSCVFRRVQRLLDAWETSTEHGTRWCLLDLWDFWEVSTWKTLVRVQVLHFEPLPALLGHGLRIMLRGWSWLHLGGLWCFLLDGGMGFHEVLENYVGWD